MRSVAFVALALGPLVSLATLLGCAGSDSDKAEPEPTTTPADKSSGNDAGGTTTGDFGRSDGASPPAENVVKEVYGHSASTLYKLDPKTKAVTEIGPFKGCDAVIDIAIDEASNLYADGYKALYTVDKTTAVCTKISGGSGLPDSFWGGKLYGFDNTGNLFEVAFEPTAIKVTDIPIPSKPKDLSFWGAASSTSAPLVAPGPS